MFFGHWVPRIAHKCVTWPPDWETAASPEGSPAKRICYVATPADSRCEELGHDIGGGKRMGETYQRTRSAENFWTPPKELLVCSVVEFCTGKTEQWHLRGVENVPYHGGVQKPFWDGCHSWGFPPPLFSTPPWRPLKKKFEIALEIEFEFAGAKLWKSAGFAQSSSCMAWRLGRCMVPHLAASAAWTQSTSTMEAWGRSITKLKHDWIPCQLVVVNRHILGGTT